MNDPIDEQRRRQEMNCEQIRPNLVAYLDGETTPQGRAEIETHLQTCPQCAAELDRLRALRAGLSGRSGRAR